MINKTLFFFVCLSFVSCYEGWEYSNYGGEEPPPQGPAAPKPIAYILLQTITPSSTALNNGDCGTDANFAEYRTNEWSARSSLAAEKLGEITDTLVVKNITIDDCSNASEVLLAALSSEPWSPSDAPSEDEDGRSTIHLVAVFSEGDLSVDPPNAVIQEHWSAWQSLVTSGRTITSARYFVLANEQTGYFSTWKANVPSNVLFEGTAIDSPNPTPSGLDERSNTIASDSEALAEWVSGL